MIGFRAGEREREKFMFSPQNPHRLSVAPSLLFSDYWREGAFYSWVKQLELEAESLAHLVLRLRISGCILPFPYAPPCREDERTLIPCKTADLQKENAVILGDAVLLCVSQ